MMKLIDRWFEERGNLSRADYEMLNRFYWLMENAGVRTKTKPKEKPKK